MAFPDLKDVGVIADFVRWGRPWHGPVSGGTLTLPNADTMAVTQPASGDVFILRVPGFTPQVRSVGELAADAALGQGWLGHAIISGSNRLCYGKALAGYSKQTWIWAVSPSEKWLVELATVYVGSPYTTTAAGASPTLTVTMTITLTAFGDFQVTPPAPVTHTINASQTLSGTWSMWGAYADPRPATNAITLVDVSSNGSRAVLKLGRTYLAEGKGARGFVELTLNSTSSVTLSVLSDASECVQTTTAPATCHWWYDANDVLQEIGILRTASAVTLLVDGVTVSTWGGTVFDGATVSGGAGSLWNVSVNGVQASYSGYEETWVWADFASGYYLGDPLLTDEDISQNAVIFIDPILYSNKAVGLSAAYRHRITMVDFPYYYYVTSEYFFGNIAHPGGVSGGVVFSPLESAICYGSITGDIFTVTSVGRGTLAVGGIVEAIGIAIGTKIIAFGTGSGGAGTYLVDPAQGSTTAPTDPITVTFNAKRFASYQPESGEITRNTETVVGYV